MHEEDLGPLADFQTLGARPAKAALKVPYFPKVRSTSLVFRHGKDLGPHGIWWQNGLMHKSKKSLILVASLRLLASFVPRD